MALVRVPSKEQGKQDDVCHIHNNHNRYVGLSRQPMTGSERLSFTDCRQASGGFYSYWFSADRTEGGCKTSLLLIVSVEQSVSVTRSTKLVEE